MKLQFYKKTENTASLDEIVTYYVMGTQQCTLLMMNKAEPIRYIITCLPSGVEVTEQMTPISQSEFLAAATRSNNAVCWYIDNVNAI